MPTDLDILFVHPGHRASVYQGLGAELSAVSTPVWCAMAASVARAAGLRVAILDCEAEDLIVADAARQIVERAPKLAAIVVYGHQPSASAQNLAFAERLRSEVGARSGGRQKQLLMGGVVATLWRSLIACEQNSAVTGVCAARGDGVWTAIGLAQALRAGTDSFDTLDCVPGLVWRDSTTETCMARVADKPLDFVPTLAYDLLDSTKYRAHNHHALTGPRAPYASIYASIGCPWRCTFCCIEAPFRDGTPGSTPGRNPYLLKPVDAVVREIDWLVEHRGARTIRFDDEMFGLSRPWVMELCAALASRPYADSLNLWAYARVDTVRLEDLPRLRRAGFRWLCYGIESASEAVRDGVSKSGYTNARVVEVVQATEAAGIEVLANYIFGLPDDTFETMQETLDQACALNAAWANFYVALPYPGSALYDQVALETPQRLPSSWLGYSQHSYETTPLPTKHLAPRDVLAFRDEAHRRYFGRRAYLDRIERKFGAEARAEVEKMNALKLKRRLLGDDP